MPNSNLRKFDHLVVLMLENRSFDNMLGYLYETDAPRFFIGRGTPVFRGLAGKELWNEDDHGRRVFVERAPWKTPEAMCEPCPDPGEFYQPHVNMQLYGRDLVSSDISALPCPAPMDGFLKDYVRAIDSPENLSGKTATASNADAIMRCFPPEAVPVLSGLARQFAVSDEWFASVPTQTYPNRSFLHVGQSYGYVDNSDYAKWLGHASEPTIFGRLSGKQGAPGWRIYWDHQDIVPMSSMISPQIDRPEYFDNYRSFERFAEDCEKGDLPAYTFIEPRLIVNHNDMHPPIPLSLKVHSSVLAGEVLVNDVYDAVRNGKSWERTLLLVTFDEHGGCYDHWPPPLGAKPPLAAPPYELEKGFRFDRFGVRVPAIFISPWIAPGTVIRSDGETPFDHTSVIRTICERWDVEGLTDRDRAAPDFGDVMSLNEPRLETPAMNPRPYVPLEPELAKEGIIHGLIKDVLELTARKLGTHLAGKRTVGEALAHLAEVQKERNGLQARHSS